MRIDPAAATTSIRDPVKRKRKMEETRLKLFDTILIIQDQIGILEAEIAACDEEIAYTGWCERCNIAAEGQYKKEQQEKYDREEAGGLK